MVSLYCSVSEILLVILTLEQFANIYHRILLRLFCSMISHLRKHLHIKCWTNCTFLLLLILLNEFIELWNVVKFINNFGFLQEAKRLLMLNLDCFTQISELTRLLRRNTLYMVSHIKRNKVWLKLVIIGDKRVSLILVLLVSFSWTVLGGEMSEIIFCKIRQWLLTNFYFIFTATFCYVGSRGVLFKKWADFLLAFFCRFLRWKVYRGGHVLPVDDFWLRHLIWVDNFDAQLLVRRVKGILILDKW